MAQIGGKYPRDAITKVASTALQFPLFILW